MNLSVRHATLADLATLVEFNVRLAKESENKTLDPQVVERGILALFDDRSKGRYFVAEENGLIVGQAMVTYEWSDWRNAWIWWLQSVYTRQSYRQKGVFRTLLRSIADAAQQDGKVAGLRLYVEKDNTTAQIAYRRCGFGDMPFRLMHLEIQP
jgi:ribosomal protein S18 acetylase RimI-like enzyme